jgi:hypothetical protein
MSGEANLQIEEKKAHARKKSYKNNLNIWNFETYK